MMIRSMLCVSMVGALWIPASAALPAPQQRFSYDSVNAGSLKGKIVVQWLEPDVFLFIPDQRMPLTFTRKSGESITPGRMLTDGGSIPRPIWVLRNYSPWGFAPAFIIHDWMFTVQQCKKDGYGKWSLEDAALTMAEVMKTMILQKKIDASGFTVSGMYHAVLSPPARSSWEKGKCNPPPAGFSGTPLRQFELSFD